MKKPEGIATELALVATAAVLALGANAVRYSDVDATTPTPSLSTPDVVGPTQHGPWNAIPNATHPAQNNPNTQGKPNDGRQVHLWGPNDGPLPELDPPTEDDIAASDPG